jgi:UDP-glucose 4-epimerase
VRNWTYIDDIVAGTILAAEKISDATPVNLGTMERIRVIDAVQMVLDYTGHRPRIVFRPEMPTGPLNRVADNTLAKNLLGWEPRVKFCDGLKRTIDWYFAARDPEQLGRELELALTER